MKNAIFFDVFYRWSHQCWNRQLWFYVALYCELQMWPIKRFFNDGLTLSNVKKLYQPKNNVEITLKCLLGNEFQSWPKQIERRVIFSQKLKKVLHLTLAFNNVNVSQYKPKIHLYIILDSKLTLLEYYKMVLPKQTET